MNETHEEALAKVGIFGAPRTGKSSSLDALEVLKPGIFERGQKYKSRRHGPWSSDNQKKDSLHVTPEEFDELERNGEIVVSWKSLDTRHGVARGDSKRSDVHISYIADTYAGYEALSRFFNPIVTFLLYANESAIKRRLELARGPPDEIPRGTIEQRLGFVRQEQALFRERANLFHFPIYSRSDEPLELSADVVQQWDESQIHQRAERMAYLVAQFNRYNHAGMTVEKLHERRSDDLVRQLLGKGLSDIAVLAERGPIKLDLRSEFDEYKKEHEVAFGIKQKILDLHVDYHFAHGRHNLMIYRIKEGGQSGLSDPSTERNRTMESSAEELVLTLVLNKLEREQGLAYYDRRRVFGSGQYTDTDSGLLQVVNATMRDGAFIAMGDPIRGVPQHRSLNIGFVYPTNGKAPEYFPIDQTSPPIRRQHPKIPNSHAEISSMPLHR